MASAAHQQRVAWGAAWLLHCQPHLAELVAMDLTVSVHFMILFFDQCHAKCVAPGPLHHTRNIAMACFEAEIRNMLGSGVPEET